MAESKVLLRTIESSDVSFVTEMTLQSAFVDESVRTAWRAMSKLPKCILKYTDNWGREGDFGLIVLDVSGNKLGAAWYRLFLKKERGDGILAHDGIPELAIAITEKYRGKGIGLLLLQALHEHAQNSGFTQLLLSVDPGNTAAIALYKKIGYVDFSTSDTAKGTSFMMVCQIRNKHFVVK